MLYPSPAASRSSWMPPADRPGLFPVRGRMEIGETEALGLLRVEFDHGPGSQREDPAARLSPVADGRAVRRHGRIENRAGMHPAAGVSREASGQDGECPITP